MRSDIIPPTLFFIGSSAQNLLCDRKNVSWNVMLNNFVCNVSKEIPTYSVSES